MTPSSSSVSWGVSTAVGSSRMSRSTPPGERLEDLDALLGADGQVLDRDVRVDAEAVPLGELADHLPGLGEVEEPCPSSTRGRG